MIEKIKNSKLTKIISVLLVISLFADIIYPNTAFALTGGPSQPEVQSFQPVGTSDMVDLFSGDFKYNIPLIDVGGYPINISYNSGIGMDQEASWVGLGWNINPGAITRNMRGLPDDFSGDLIEKEFSMKENKTYGVTIGVGAEIAGYDGLSLNFSLGIRYNNYTGYATERSGGINYSMGSKTSMTAGLSLTSSSDGGLGISPSLSFSAKMESAESANVSGSLSFGATINSRAGLQYINMGVGVSQSVADDPTTAKNDESGTVGSLNGGVGKSFGVKTYVPSIDMPMKNSTYTLNGKLGGTLFSIDGSVSLSGYYSKQILAKKEDKVPAYGYMYSEKSGMSSNALLDFNREKDGAFSRNTPALPLTNFSYDIFSVAGQGVGGTYRPFRSDLGVIYDRSVSNTSDSYNVGLDVKLGNTAQGGGNVTVVDVNTTTGKWTNSDHLSSRIPFNSKQLDDDFEPYYFKQVGEKAVDEDDMYASIVTDDAVMFQLVEKGGLEVHVNNNLVKSIEGVSESTLNESNSKRKERQKRNQDVSVVTKAEYLTCALDNSLYTEFSSFAKEHHIAEMSILRPDGSRYVYGLPVYNKIKHEVTFSIDGTKDGNNEISYSSTDASTDNENGKDNYYSKTKVPPYAHSYMLTAVLSHDYIDITGDGPSEDDLGSYTKFEYTKVADYQWRTPYNTGKACFNEGLKTKDSDNKANYIYGVKDVYYLSEIRTNNYVAEFTLETRDDGHGVAGETGGYGSTSVNKYLKKISLYSSNEYKKAVPVAIKEVHFEYDYSLCEGVQNNNGTGSNGGKLTLKKLYFTYMNSYKGKYNAYEFEYTDEANDLKNPDYSSIAYDRWGNYKPNDISGLLNNSDFPYVEQNKTLADKYSSAWNMTKIKLPSGGQIDISYESDDYAYVQNKKAMQMFRLAWVSDEDDQDTPPTPVGELKNSLPYLYFEIPSEVSDTELDNMVDFSGEMYFRILAYVNRSESNDGYEYVSGYANINKTTIRKFYYDGKRHACIEFLATPDTDLSNPLAQAAVQFGRLNTPRLVYAEMPTDESKDSEASVLNFLKSMSQSSFAKTILEAAKGGPNNSLFGKGIGTQINPVKSWIRLNVPQGYKYGGGVRVSEIKLTDNWSAMNNTQGSNAVNQVTGQTYTYTKIEDGKTISSGVAQYEPMVGADENPFRTPESAGGEKAFLAPDDRFYQENPYGESFFPSPSVGYSKVTVANISNTSVTKHGTGCVVHEFFTARDYPVFTNRTEIHAIESKSGFLGELLKIDVKDYMTASQGFVIELNDMHGKEKAQWVYPEASATPISGVEYFYKDNGKVIDGKVIRGDKLVNEDVSVIMANGKFTEATIGIEFDFVTDMREHKTVTKNSGVQVNLYGFFAGPIPIVIPPIWPVSNREETRFRSVTTTKVVNRYGLLDRTIAYDLGSNVSVENLVYDGETGEVLLTHTTNEFEDDVYSMNYPAHWAYDGMGQSYRNIGYTYKASYYSESPGKLTVHGPSEVYVPGDEVMVTDGTTKTKAWIVSYYNGEIELVDKYGGFIYDSGSGSYEIKVIRSGRRNMQTISIGSVSTQQNPTKSAFLNVDRFGDFDENADVLNASAVEFMDVWKRASKCNPPVPTGAPCERQMAENEYNNGRFGIWRMKKSHLYLTDRVSSISNRYAGDYTNFSPFWAAPTGNGTWTKNSNNWTWTSEVTNYSPFGFELENKDALERFSSAIYRYNNKLPVAVSANARVREVLFDGFEDYSTGNCVNRFYPFESVENQVTTEEAHTGKSSFKVSKGTSHTITKKVIPEN